MKKLTAWLVNALVRVGAEEVPLGLQQVRGQTRRAESIVKGQRGRESRCWDTIFNGLNDCAPPGGLVVIQHLAEETIDQQIRELRILVVSFFDLSEKATANYAAAAPHKSDPPEV